MRLGGQKETKKKVKRSRRSFPRKAGPWPSPQALQTVSLSALQKTLEVPTTLPASPGAGTRLAKEEARGELFWKVRTS